MLDRFYYSRDWQAQVTLELAESHHLSRVMRKQVGDEVELFNGRGESASARVFQISKRDVVLTIQNIQQALSNSSPLLTLAVAPPKGDRLRWLIEKATEIGVSKIIPLKTSRSVVEPGSSKLDKLEQTVISACKQCRRNSLMQIEKSCSLYELFLNTQLDNMIHLFGSPHGSPVPVVFNSIQPLTNICVLIGPEGGFSPNEEELFAHHKTLGVRLSPNILRIETAAISLASSLISLIDAQSAE